MIFYKEERCAMFIDGANLYAAARGLGLISTIAVFSKFLPAAVGLCAPSTTPR